MKAQPAKDDLVAVFQNIIEGDRDSRRKSQQFLLEASQNAGFTTNMINILSHSSLSVSIKHVVLDCFSKHIKRYWAQSINNEEKQIVKRSIIDLIIECDRNLMRLFREVFAFLIVKEYRNWPIVDLIADRLNEEDNLVPLFNILLSISNSFEYSIHQDERSFFFGTLRTFLPIILGIVNKFQDKELIYLSIKLIYKAVYFQINAEVKRLVCDWMPLICSAVGATNPEFDRCPEENQRQHSQEFYYFHSKKWATRIFIRFVQKHAKITVNARHDNRIFGDFWYANHGGYLITSLINQMSIKTTNKIRCLQMKCLLALVIERPAAVDNYAELLQYNILIPLIRLQPEDQELANTDTLKFIRKEQPQLSLSQNLKITALQTWAAFSELGMQHWRLQTYEPGVFFYQNINYIQSKLRCNDPVEKELGMRLLCRLHSSITKSAQTKRILPLLLAKYIIPQFESPIMFLRARTADIFKQYGIMQTNKQIITLAAQGIYTCLTQEYHPLVCIKATFALESILVHKIAKEFFRPFLKNILFVYFKLLQDYWLVNIKTSLQAIIQGFSQELSPFAVELVQSLHKAFLKIFNKDVLQNNNQDYDGQAGLEAAECIKIIKEIIQSPIAAEMVPEMESVVVSIAELSFGEHGANFLDDCMELLNAYLYKTKTLSGEMWFYCQTVVYNIVGIHNNTLPILDNLPLRQNQIKLWKQASYVTMLKMEDSVQLLRNYILKISTMKDQANFQAITTNLISLLFYLFDRIYKYSSEPYSESNDTAYCSMLMIIMLENFQSILPDAFYTHIWNQFKISLLLPPGRIKVVNSQLLSMLLWAAPKQILTLAYRQGFIHKVLTEIIQHKQKYKRVEERSRVIFGICSLLQFANEFSEIIEKTPQLIEFTLSLLQKNAVERSNSKRIAMSSEEEDDGEDNSGMLSFDSEDSWDENFYKRYESPLKFIDEISESIIVIKQLVYLVQAEDQEVILQRIDRLKYI